MRWIAAFALLLTAPALRAATLTLAEYESALTKIRGLIAAGEAGAARAEAKTLADSDIDSPAGRFRADSTLLAEVNGAKPRDLGVEARIDATLAALHGAGSAKAAAVDRALMQRLQREQTDPELRRGGNVQSVKVRSPLLKRVAGAMGDAVEWVGRQISKFLDWLGGLWPDSAPRKLSTGSGMRGAAGSLVALIILVLGVLAFEVVRRSRKAMPELAGQSAPLGSSRDDDPLSRGANEWERYAAQLASAGRLREAIRAWYHAVLVTLWGAHVLQFRKGRTNWEYVAHLGPEISWRPQIIQLTRRFEVEWYGSDQSSAEALDECSAAARHILGSVRRTKRVAA